MNNKRMTVGFLLGVFALGFSCPQGLQNSGVARAGNPRDNVEVANLEVAVNEAAQRTFSGAFGMIHRPKGGYLPGYGFVVSFIINIDMGMRATPFGMMRSGPQVTPEEKRRHIDTLKDELVRALFGSRTIFDTLQKGESVAIMAFFEDSNPLLPPGKEDRTLVMSVSKADLDLLASKAVQFNEFKQKVKTIEY